MAFKSIVHGIILISYGPSTMDYGLWTIDYGLWAMDPYCSSCKKDQKLPVMMFGTSAVGTSLVITGIAQGVFFIRAAAERAPKRPFPVEIPRLPFIFRSYQ